MASLPHQVRGDVTLHLKKKVLEALAKTGVITYAARKAGVARQTVYAWCADDPDFKAAFDEALVASTELLEAEAYRRAHDGVLKPVFQGGQRVGSIREYSDTLLIFLLKARKPETYRERLDVRQRLTGEDGGPVRFTLTFDRPGAGAGDAGTEGGAPRAELADGRDGPDRES
jgi:hypothetical protein